MTVKPLIGLRMNFPVEFKLPAGKPAPCYSEESVSMRSFSFVSLVLALSVSFSCLFAQTRVTPRPAEPREFDFYGRGPWRASIPRPATVLGYEPGTFHTTYGNYEKVLRAMAEKSDRLRTFELGKTPEYRTLYLHAISSPANLSRLEEIKSNVRRLADPRIRLSDAERDGLIAKTPLIIWFSYAIHGDESAGFEAGMHVLYQLLASDDAAIAKALERVVVLINPCQNPDGHERFVAWYNTHGIGRPEPFAWEKENHWNVSGRYNHFYFDLNRDMVALSQIESRTAAAAFREWRPQVVADHHGETPSYFFPPAALPINHNLPRVDYERWLDTFGRGNARAFDRYGWMYFVRDTFDVFYPGYWDSWPSLHGATGMTYETEGGGRRGFRERRDDETEVTLRESIAMHVTASLATLETAAEHRERRLGDFRQFFVDALRDGASGTVRRYLFPPATDPARMARFLEVLDRNGIEIERTTGPIAVSQSFDYLGGAPIKRDFPVGTLVVDLAQPQSRVAKALLELDSPQDAEFLERQEEKRQRNEKRGKKAPKDEYEFYDFTAWSLPVAFGVDAYWTADSAAWPTEKLTGTWKPESPGAPAEANTAYVFTPETEGGYRLALALLNDGYRVAAATRPLRAAGRTFPRGTFVVRVDRNPRSLHAQVAGLAKSIGVKVTSLDTAYTDEGITGVGSGTVVSLQRPQVALLVGSPTQPTSYGTLRAVLEKIYGLDFVPVSVSALRTMRLNDFSSVILPDGSASKYAESLGDEGIAKLKAWVEQGGTLIAVGGAAEFAAGEGVELTTAKIVGREEDEEGSEEKANGTPNSAPVLATVGEESHPAPAADAAPVRAGATGVPSAPEASAVKQPAKPLPIPGAILRAQVDRFHFLSFGIERNSLPLLVEGDTFFTTSKTGTNVLTFDTPDPATPLRLAGFVWKDNTEVLLRGTAALIEEPMGDGHVVLFANEPGQRLIWHATTQLLINAVLYGPSINHIATGY